MGSQFVRKINRIGAPVPINTLDSSNRKTLGVTRMADSQPLKQRRRDDTDKPTGHRHSPYFPTQRPPKTATTQESFDDSIYDSQDDMLSVSSATKTKTIRDVGAAPAFRLPSVPSGSQKRSRGRRSRGHMDLTNDSDVSESTLRDRISTPSPSPSRIVSDIATSRKKTQQQKSPYRMPSPILGDGLDSIEDSDDDISQLKQASSTQKLTQEHSQPIKKANHIVMKLRRALSGRFMYENGDESARNLSIRCHLTTPGIGRPFAITGGRKDFKWLRLNFEMLTSVRYAAGCAIILINRPRSADAPSPLILEFENLASVDYIVEQMGTKAKIMDQTRLKKTMEEAWRTTDIYRQKATKSTQLDKELLQNAESEKKQTVTVQITATKPPKPDATASSKSHSSILVSNKQTPSKLNNQRGAPEHGKPITDSRATDWPEIRNIRETRSSTKSSPAPRREKPLETWTELNPGWRDLWSTPLTYPMVGKNRATVDLEDIARLDEGEYLNDNLITFYFRYFQERLKEFQPELARKVHFFNSFFYDKLRQKPTNGSSAFDGVRSWTSKIDLFDFDYVFLPVNEYMHWYLVIIANPGHTLPANSLDDGDMSRGDELTPRTPLAEVEKDISGINIDDHNVQRQTRQRPGQDLFPAYKNGQFKSEHGIDKRTIKAPRIITLDSLGNNHPTTIRVLKSYLVDEAKDKKGIVGTSAIGLTAKYGLPQQDNYCDCGIFLIAYMELFLQDPEYAFEKMSNRESVEWSINPSKLRADLRDLIFKLHEEQDDQERQAKLARKAARAAAISSPVPQTLKAIETDVLEKRPASAEAYRFAARVDDEQLADERFYSARSSPTKGDNTMEARASEASRSQYPLIKKLASSPTPGLVGEKRKARIESDEEPGMEDHSTVKRPKATSDSSAKRLSWPLRPHHDRKAESIDTKASRRHVYLGSEKQVRRR